jgi:hydroxyacylglutathione hydrolase
LNELTIVKTTKLFFKNYTYFIRNSDNNCAVVVDPSWNLEKYTTYLDGNGAKLNAILLTHHHMDHTNLADNLAKLYNCPVYMVQEEIEYYKFKCFNLHPIPPDVEELNVSGINIKVIRTPGHTYCGACYLIDNNLFTGDTLFMEGCGMCNIDGGDPRKMYNSIQKLLKIIPATTHIFPGHQYTYSIGQTFAVVKGFNVYLNFKDVESFVRFRMRTGQNGLLDFS